MFPDPDLEWHAYPSIIDGVEAPFAINKGQWEGKLHLLVVDNSTTPTGMAARSRFRSPAFGISIKCEIYLAVEEVLYCTAGHGDGWTRSYIKETRNSRLIAAILAHDPVTRSLHPNTRVPRHFCFGGYDYCYETVGFHEPAIRPFTTVDAGYAWVPGDND